MKKYYVYMTTNPTKTTVYVGMTNSLKRRMKEHFNGKGSPKTFTGRYNCYNLIWFEEYQYVWDAIYRERQIKRWSRVKKENLVDLSNPDWDFLIPPD